MSSLYSLDCLHRTSLPWAWCSIPFPVFKEPSWSFQFFLADVLSLATMYWTYNHHDDHSSDPEPSECHSALLSCVLRRTLGRPNYIAVNPMYILQCVAIYYSRLQNWWQSAKKINTSKILIRSLAKLISRSGLNGFSRQKRRSNELKTGFTPILSPIATLQKFGTWKNWP
jgi:hypothetical protein